MSLPLSARGVATAGTQWDHLLPIAVVHPAACLALLVMGAGWHNSHHHDPASAGVEHRWWELDVTSLFILGLEAVGLATDVIRQRHLRRAERASA